MAYLSGATIVCDPFWILLFLSIFVTDGVRGSPGRPVTGGGATGAAVTADERQNLTCYSCNSQLEGEGCRFPHNLSRAMMRICPASHRFCSVIRVDYSVDPGGSTYAFSIERTCSEQCTVECNAVGERLRLYLCRSCCTESLCNTDNTAVPASWMSSPGLLLVITVLTSLRPYGATFGCC